ncbi:nucleotidyltransferase domain-containing protein [Endozoicomonas arenosclerae]|uniref:nucleotidyltransferase domain-containing protein n=1 Tax=Endozoicomonas arenosclerae TaxID=1633495 RepID=UPI000780A4E7|nr:nucleotidyltransferase domain-containing protein [Endozoicomonas arenosclerae]
MENVYLELVNRIKEERYPDAEVVFLAGSHVRGEATRYSDLDLVVVYESLKEAYRESFIFDAMPVEAFVHDPETLEYFFNQVDRPSGIPSLMNMVVEGIEVPASTAFSASVKSQARRVLDLGPPQLSESEVNTARYVLTDMLDDIRAPRNYSELVATSSTLYQKLADFYLRTQGLWSAKGKSIPRRLKACNEPFQQQLNRAFEHLFQKGETEPVIKLVEQVLNHHGGLLFDGYKLIAPEEWREDLKAP